MHKVGTSQPKEAMLACDACEERFFTYNEIQSHYMDGHGFVPEYEQHQFSSKQGKELW